MSAAATRSQIVEAADRMFYEQGFEHTSFAAIAKAVDLSKGNFYYHFKTKDDILAAVIDARLAGTRAMLACWEATEPTPAGRVGRFIDIVVANRADIQHYGCPVGTLTGELAKLNHPARDEAAALFTLFRTWLAEQFALLGRAVDADALAMHVLAFSQGVATLTNAFGDEDFTGREVRRMHDWLEAIAARAATHGESDIAAARS